MPRRAAAIKDYPLHLLPPLSVVLSSCAEERRQHFDSKVRRAALCTTACWPKFCEHLPCSSTHPITPDPTLCISGGTLKKRTAKISNCRLCFARRWDLKRQTLSLVGPTPPPRFRYSAPRLSSRPGWCCPVEHLRAYVLCWLAMGAAHAFVLLLWAVPFIPCSVLIECTRI